MSAQNALREIQKLQDPAKASFFQGFFKTGKGQYGEGDRFLGLTVPLIRQIAKKHHALTFADLKVLLQSPFHEVRLMALIVLTEQYAKGQETHKERVFRFYLKNKAGVNNWDLVDSSASYIVGKHLLQRDRALLYKLVRAPRMWDRRIAIISTHAFIRANDFQDTLRLSELLLDDQEDLMHKAVGWMLREVGKRNVTVLERFLKLHAAHLPRTALRYAIERFPEAQRKKYLAIKKK